jgi:hypothetical protein
MLVKNPDDRYPSIREALQDLGEVPSLTVGMDTGRARMIELANAAMASSGDVAYSTPRSPNEFLRNSKESVVTTTGGKPEFRRWIVQRALAAAGVVALSLSVSLAVGKLTGGASNGPVPTVMVGQPTPVAAEPAATESQTTEAQTAEQRATQPTPEQASAAGEGSTPSRPAVTQPARVNGSNSAVNGGSQPVAAPPPPSKGEVLLGTRGAGAVLYVNGKPLGVMEGLKSWPVEAGEIALSVRAQGCVPWDSTVVVRAGQTTRVGYRQPRCEGERL